MSIAYGGIVAFFFRGLNVGVALITVLLASHVLSTDDYGVLALALAAIGIVTAMTSGLTAATAYQIANQRRGDGEALLSAGSLALALGVVALLAGVLGMQVLSGQASTLSLTIGAASAAVLINGVVGGVFLGRDDLFRYNITLVLPPFFALVSMGVVFFIFNHRTPESALVASVSGQWGAAVVVTTMCVKTGRSGFRYSRSLAILVLRFTIVAGMASGISYLNYRADLFMVAHFEGESGVGVYAIAGYIAESIWQVSSSLALATYARLGSVSRPEAVALTTRIMRHTVVILGVICIGMFVIAGLLQSILFSKYDGMATALRFLLPGVLLYSLAQAYSAFYTYQRGWPWVSAIVAGGGLIVDISLDVALIPAMGVNGAALASSIAYSVAIIGALIVFVRTEHVRASDVFRFGKADVDDYRTLVTRLRARF
ncbi:MAG: polysaccharide biosynthesis C-terminal domain-containing protein [Tepidiformaceae bacterium]